MIGPPGLPKLGRRVFSFAVPQPARSRHRSQVWHWAAGFYLAGVLAHYSHYMAFDLPTASDSSLGAVLTSAPSSFVWPAGLIGTLIDHG